MAAQRLRPQAERTLRRAAASGVQRDVRIEQEWNVVARHIEIALVNVNHIGQRIEICDVGPVRIVNHFTAGIQIGGSQNFVQRLAVGELHGREVEFATNDEVDGCSLTQ